jgi:hypothetical protein
MCAKQKSHLKFCLSEKKFHVCINVLYLRMDRQTRNMTFSPQCFHVSQYLHIETRSHMKNIAISHLRLLFIIITFNSQRSPSRKGSWKKNGMYRFSSFSVALQYKIFKSINVLFLFKELYHLISFGLTPYLIFLKLSFSGVPATN